MAQRIVIRVLGNQIAPYNASINLTGGAVSEDMYVNVSQLQGGEDTTAAQRAQFPNALSWVNVVRQSNLTSNHVKSTRYYINITSAALQTLANA